MAPSKLSFEVTQLQNLLVTRAEHRSVSDFEYQELRDKLIQDEAVSELLPDFVRSCRNLDQFWSYIRKFKTYKERREFIWEAFAPVLEELEKGVGAPVHQAASEALADLDASHVRELWRKALARAGHDPEGAITAARALVESVCKLVLDARRLKYDSEAELPKLYKTAAESLDLGVDKQQHQVFKQILSGMATVVNGLAAVRNKLGDAHGQGANPVRPDFRHAQLAVHLAGTFAMFMVQTFEHMHGDALHTRSPEDDVPAF